jgi:prepilin-type processing-associated H-X9-DG protein
MYDNKMYDLFDKYTDKYIQRITNDWNIPKYKNKTNLTREEILDALNIYRGKNGTSNIYGYVAAPSYHTSSTKGWATYYIPYYLEGAPGNKTAPNDPSAVPLMGDSCYSTDQCMWYTIECSCSGKSKKGAYLVHSKQANMLMVDGHVEPWSKEKFDIKQNKWHSLQFFEPK